MTDEDKPKIIKFNKPRVIKEVPKDDVLFTITQCPEHVHIEFKSKELVLAPKDAIALGLMLVVAAKNIITDKGK